MALHSLPQLKRPAVVLATGIALFVVFVGPGTEKIQAHGAGTEIFREVDGPFVIAVRILPLQPLVGKLHLTVTVDLLETGEPVGDARVRVTGRRQEGSATPRFSPALNIPTERRFYDANFDIEDAGIWDFEVEVESDAGEGKVRAPVSIVRRVRGETLGLPGTMIFVLVTGALFGGVAWIAYTARKKQRMRSNRAGHA
ncbi:MAG: hypothetical protein QF554_06995 [Dehalococcoidia bacterium]|nr:hypothetical protein [Dehalococcoidia bacterium]